MRSLNAFITIWQEKQLLHGQRKKPNFQLEQRIDVSNADEEKDLCGTLVYAESVSENSQTKERFQEYENHLGNLKDLLAILN